MRQLQVFTARNAITSGGKEVRSSRLERILHYSNSIEKVTGILARVLMMARTRTVIKPKSPELLTCSVSVSDWARGQSLLFMLSMKDMYAVGSSEGTSQKEHDISKSSSHLHLPVEVRK